MAVTELTTLRLPTGESPSSSASLRSSLQKAKSIAESYSDKLSQTISFHESANPTHISDSELQQSSAKDDSLPHKFHYYAQHEDPSVLYLLGSWPSAALHLQSFLPSPEGASFVAALSAAGVKVTDTTHVELAHSSIPLDAPVLVIRQHTVRPMDNANFEEAFDTNKHALEHFSKRKLAGGWKHKDNDDDLSGKDTFVLFSGWDDVDHHSRFEQSDEAAAYKKIVEWIDEGGLEVRHAVLVDLGA